MWYSSTKRLLESVVRWLKTERPQEEPGWQAQTDLVLVCLEEIREMSKPAVNPARLTASRYVHCPVTEKLNRATPHLRAMLKAMRDRDRIAALAHGENSLQRL